MSEITTAQTELLNAAAIRGILASPGPCITILLPPYRPGEAAGSPSALLKAYLHEAAHELGRRGVSESAIPGLLKPLEQLREGPAMELGSPWSRAILLSPSVFQQFLLTGEVRPSLSVGGAFSIRPLAPELTRPHALWVLALSKSGVSLWRGAGLSMESAALPSGVPETLDAALAFDPPDHDLENRSAVGTSTGAMHSLRFGTGSGRERQHAHLADYYKLVDRGLQSISHEPETPVILAGVEEDVAIYRAASTSRSLAKGSILGSPDFDQNPGEILRQAYSILRAEETERQHACLLASKERTAPPRLSTDSSVILRAAFDGHVAQLYLRDQATQIGVFERGTYHDWGEEDLLNLAAVQTTLHNGSACEIPSEMMPDAADVIGIMRF